MQMIINMKKIILFIATVISTQINTICQTDTFRYKVNFHTGKMDMVGPFRNNFDTVAKLYSKYQTDLLFDQKVNKALGKSLVDVDSIETVYNLTDTTAENVARTIYIDIYTGNDTTGNGSSGTPYRTFGKAITTVKNIIKTTITFNFSRGTHNIIQANFDYITKNWFLYSQGITPANVQLVGTMVQLAGSLVCTKDANNPFIINVAGASWSANQYEGRFLYNGTNYFPIESNTTNTLEGALVNVSAGTHSIWEDSTTINITGMSTNDGINVPIRSNSVYYSSASAPFDYAVLQFKNCKIKSSSNYISRYSNTSNTIPISFNTCYFNNINDNIISYHGISKILPMTRCFIKTWQTSDGSVATASYYGSFIYMQWCVLRNNVNTGCYAIYPWAGFYFINGSVISNYKYAILSTSLHYNPILQNIYIKNCQNVFRSGVSFPMNLNYSFYNAAGLYCNLSNNTNLLYCDKVPGIINLKLYSSTGFTNIWNSSSVYKKYNVPSDGVSIQIPYLYTENENNAAISLANNSTDSITIGVKLYNRIIELNYNITRGTTYKSQKLRIINTGTILKLDSLSSITIGDDCGVTIDGAYYSSANPGNLIKLKWTTTNTGTSATFKYDAIRQNY